MEEFAFWAKSDSKLHNDETITDKIKNSIAAAMDCQRAQLWSILRFFGFIQAHSNEHICLLVEMVPDNQLIGQEEIRFVVLVRGLKTPAKKSLTNDCLTIFAVNMCKLNMSKENCECATEQQKADAKHKPSSLSTFFKHTFACFALKQVNCSSGEFKNHVGSFHATLKHNFKATLKLRPDCGVRKAAPANLQVAAKVRQANPQPFKSCMNCSDNSGHTALLQIIAHSVGETFMLLGGKEVSDFICPTSIHCLFFCDIPFLLFAATWIDAKRF